FPKLFPDRRVSPKLDSSSQIYFQSQAAINRNDRGKNILPALESLTRIGLWSEYNFGR
ncbi:hypothetical protein LINGRAHAP2_LOCUS13912, partial [Linum grandiflorum]